MTKYRATVNITPTYVPFADNTTQWTWEVTIQTYASIGPEWGSLSNWDSIFSETSGLRFGSAELAKEAAEAFAADALKAYNSGLSGVYILEGSHG